MNLNVFTKVKLANVGENMFLSSKSPFRLPVRYKLFLTSRLIFLPFSKNITKTATFVALTYEKGAILA